MGQILSFSMNGWLQLHFVSFSKVNPKGYYQTHTKICVSPKSTNCRKNGAHSTLRILICLGRSKPFCTRWHQTAKLADLLLRSREMIIFSLSGMKISRAFKQANGFVKKEGNVSQSRGKHGNNILTLCLCQNCDLVACVIKITCLCGIIIT